MWNPQGGFTPWLGSALGPMDSWIFKGQFQGSNLLWLNISLYYSKALETGIFKIGSHNPFGYLKHKLWPKEELGVKLPIWIATTKSHESPWCTYVKVARHILVKRCWWGLQLCFRPHLNHMSTQEVMGFQCHGSPKTKWHLGVGLVTKYKEYYKGEGDGFPLVWAMVSLVSLCLLVVHLCTKNAPTTH